MQVWRAGVCKEPGDAYLTGELKCKPKWGNMDSTLSTTKNTFLGGQRNYLPLTNYREDLR